MIWNVGPTVKQGTALQNCVQHYHKDLLDKAREKGFGFRDGRPLSDLELLAELQHFGAATCLLDFTTDPLVALYFALGEGEGTETGGRIFICPASSMPVIPVTGEQQEIEDRQKIEKIIGEGPMIWRPIMHGAAERRIIRQSGVFVINAREIMTESGITEKVAQIGDLEKITHPIPSADKKNLRKELEESFGISVQSLFIDLAGFAQNNHYQEDIVDPFIEFYRAETSFIIGDYDNAIKRLNKAIELRPEFPAAIENLGMVMRELGRRKQKNGRANEANDLFTEAINNFDKVIRMGVSSVGTFRNLGLTKFRKGDTEAAIADLKEAIKLDPTDIDSFRILGEIFRSKQNFAEARKYYTKALSLATAQNRPEETIIKIQEELDALGSEDDPPNTPS